MNTFQSLAGMVEVELISADVTRMLELLCKQGIRLRDIVFRDDLTVRFCISRTSCGKLKSLLSGQENTWRVQSRQGMYWHFRSLLCRPVLILGVFFFLVMLWYIPGRIFFVRIEGNTTVCSKKILEAASDLGITFGASRRYVRSEQVKNGLLSALEELEWAGVNTKGCVAVVSVREHLAVDASPVPRYSGDVVAIRDGVVLSCDVTQGSLNCYPGQAVKEGQILISGTADHGTVVTSIAAEGEVFASTQRQISLLTHVKTLRRVQKYDRQVKFRLLIGKKLINFFKGSGISGGTCVKMYSKYILTLPGGFCLPVALIQETLQYGEFTEETVEESDLRKLLSDFAYRYTREQMIAGRILVTDEAFSLLGDAYQMTGNYACTEMIGRVQQEQIGAYNGKTD